MKQSHLPPQFVEFIPVTLQDGILYISPVNKTVLHKCCCGCGQEVVTTLSPTDWSFTFDGKSVSVSPSIGSWSLPCQSHYWIKKNNIVWAGKMSKDQIDRIRVQDKQATENYYYSNPVASDKATTNKLPDTPNHVNSTNIWQRLKSWWYS